MSNFYYVDDEHPIIHQAIWEFLVQDEPLTLDDFRGDTQPLDIMFVDCGEDEDGEQDEW